MAGLMPKALAISLFVFANDKRTRTRFSPAVSGEAKPFRAVILQRPPRGVNLLDVASLRRINVRLFS